jgi:hypothetical protein
VTMMSHPFYITIISLFVKCFLTLALREIFEILLI